MWNRRNQILAGILALQIVVAVVIFWPRGAASEAQAEPLLANLKTDEVVSLTITDRDGNVVELARNGQDWVLSQRDNYPAVGSRVTDLLTRLQKIRTNRLIARTAGSHRQLQVAADDFNRRIEIRSTDATTYTVYIGTSGGGSAAHVRVADQNEVYLTSEVLSWDVNATESSWVETLFFTVPQTATVGITLENAHGKLEFERPNGESEWTMKGLTPEEKLVQNNVQDLLSQITSMHMQGPLGKTAQKNYGMEQPQAVIILKTKEGDQEKRYTLTIGAKLEEDVPSDSSVRRHYYVLSSSESPYFVRISEFFGNNLVNKKRADFLPETATPTPTFQTDESSSGEK